VVRTGGSRSRRLSAGWYLRRHAGRKLGLAESACKITICPGASSGGPLARSAPTRGNWVCGVRLDGLRYLIGTMAREKFVAYARPSRAHLASASRRNARRFMTSLTAANGRSSRSSPRSRAARMAIVHSSRKPSRRAGLAAQGSSSQSWTDCPATRISCSACRRPAVRRKRIAPLVTGPIDERPGKPDIAPTFPDASRSWSRQSVNNNSRQSRRRRQGTR
jgi:hypothetical protein